MSKCNPCEARRALQELLEIASDSVATQKMSDRLDGLEAELEGYLRESWAEIKRLREAAAEVEVS